jgi:hypothetical protein
MYIYTYIYIYIYYYNIYIYIYCGVCVFVAVALFLFVVVSACLALRCVCFSRALLLGFGLCAFLPGCVRLFPVCMMLSLFGSRVSPFVVKWLTISAFEMKIEMILESLLCCL